MDLRCRWCGLSFVKMVVVIYCVISTLCLSSACNPDSSRPIKIRDFRTMQVESGDVAIRRKLIGPGSHPPRCMFKCGNCSPCRPVHVAVPPGSHVIMEYYPEAWRCMCGNRLYMP
ncbi:hypothetical protein LUZ60_003903 [Juncus effusus]|nr:hypothetical protein LUZ60_003903 [Juncus effusus]